MSRIFVFGSNLAGVHGAGAAAEAVRSHGARMRVGVGRTGNAYALPTKDERIQTLPLHRISSFVRAFCEHASDHPEDTFFVTRIGCGLAGYADREIAPMFSRAPGNCILPIEWKPYLDEDVTCRVQFHRWEDEQRRQPA